MSGARRPKLPPRRVERAGVYQDLGEIDAKLGRLRRPPSGATDSERKAYDDGYEAGIKLRNASERWAN